MDIDTLIKLNHRYLVSQTYNRAFDHLTEDKKIDLLVTDYDDLGLAKIHLNAVKNDDKGAIIDLGTQKHLKTIREMLVAESKYTIYWAVIKSRKELAARINKVYNDNMRRYIDNKTNWTIKGSAILTPTVQMTFGELFIVLKYGSQTLRIKFEDIEAM